MRVPQRSECERETFCIAPQIHPRFMLTLLATSACDNYQASSLAGIASTPHVAACRSRCLSSLCHPLLRRHSCVVAAISSRCTPSVCSGPRCIMPRLVAAPRSLLRVPPHCANALLQMETSSFLLANPTPTASAVKLRESSECPSTGTATAAHPLGLPRPRTPRTEALGARAHLPCTSESPLAASVAPAAAELARQRRPMKSRVAL